MTDQLRPHDACPSADDLMRAMQREPPAEVHAALVDHLLACSDCYERCVALARELPPTDAERRRLLARKEILLARLRRDPIAQVTIEPPHGVRWWRAAAIVFFVLLCGVVAVAAVVRPDLLERAGAWLRDRVLPAQHEPADSSRPAPKPATPREIPAPSPSRPAPAPQSDLDQRALEALLQRAKNAQPDPIVSVPEPGLSLWVARSFASRPEVAARFLPDLLRHAALVERSLRALHELARQYPANKERSLSPAARATLDDVITLHHTRLHHHLNELRQEYILALVDGRAHCPAVAVDAVPARWRARTSQGVDLMRAFRAQMMSALAQEDLSPEANQAIQSTFYALWDTLNCVSPPPSSAQ